MQFLRRSHQLKRVTSKWILAVFREAKSLTRRHTKAHRSAIHLMARHLQRHHNITIFRLGSSHYQLRALLYRLGLAVIHSRQPIWDTRWPCETGPQTAEHVLHTCCPYRKTQTQLWSQGAKLAGKLRGPTMDQVQTTNFINSQTHERFKRTLFIRTKTHSANFRGYRLYQATKRHLNNS